MIPSNNSFFIKLKYTVREDKLQHSYCLVHRKRTPRNIVQDLSNYIDLDDLDPSNPSADRESAALKKNDPSKPSQQAQSKRKCCGKKNKKNTKNKSSTHPVSLQKRKDVQHLHQVKTE